MRTGQFGLLVVGFIVLAFRWTGGHAAETYTAPTIEEIADRCILILKRSDPDPAGGVRVAQRRLFELLSLATDPEHDWATIKPICKSLLVRPTQLQGFWDQFGRNGAQDYVSSQSWDQFGQGWTQNYISGNAGTWNPSGWDWVLAYNNPGLYHPSFNTQGDQWQNYAKWKPPFQSGNSGPQRPRWPISSGLQSCR